MVAGLFEHAWCRPTLGGSLSMRGLIQPALLMTAWRYSIISGELRAKWTIS